MLAEKDPGGPKICGSGRSGFGSASGTLLCVRLFNDDARFKVLLSFNHSPSATGRFYPVPYFNFDEGHNAPVIGRLSEKVYVYSSRFLFFGQNRRLKK